MFVMLTLPGLDLVNRFPLWLTVLVISRDIAIVLTVAVVNLAVARRTFRPSLLGKAATVIYVFTCVLTLIANYLARPLAHRHDRDLDVARRDAGVRIRLRLPRHALPKRGRQRHAESEPAGQPRRRLSVRWQGEQPCLTMKP